MRNFLIFVFSVMIVIGLFFVSRSYFGKKVPKAVVLTEEEKRDQEKKTLLQDAYAYQESGQLDLALSTFKSVVKKYPSDKEGLQASYQAGVILEKMEKYLQADHYFDLMPQGVQGQSDYYASVLEIRAKRLTDKGKFKEALILYRQIMEQFIDYKDLSKIEKKWRDLVFQLFMSSRVGDFSTYYEVVLGDSLYVIAKKYQTTVDYIEQVNHLKPGLFIHPGDRLKVPRPDLQKELDVDLTRRVLSLKFDGYVIREYKIAIGEDGRTPVGEYRVQNKLKNPVWFHDGEAIPFSDSRNILGSRWIGFDKDIGIHGTVDPSDLWSQVSNGCVRMHNEDIEELYVIVTEGMLISLEE